MYVIFFKQMTSYFLEFNSFISYIICSYLNSNNNKLFLVSNHTYLESESSH